MLQSGQWYAKESLVDSQDPLDLILVRYKTEAIGDKGKVFRDKNTDTTEH